jgi:hypothetical protein
MNNNSEWIPEPQGLSLMVSKSFSAEWFKRGSARREQFGIHHCRFQAGNRVAPEFGDLSVLTDC